jgi:hypothetical protein
LFTGDEIAPGRLETIPEEDADSGEIRMRERFTPPRFQDRRVIDPETGAPHVRLGVQVDQLLWLALAAIAPQARFIARR